MHKIESMEISKLKYLSKTIMNGKLKSKSMMNEIKLMCLSKAKNIQRFNKIIVCTNTTIMNSSGKTNT